MIWMHIRQHYALLHELLLIMDDELSLIILLSSASNMYFICLQLFNSFNQYVLKILCYTKVKGEAVASHLTHKPSITYQIGDEVFLIANCFVPRSVYGNVLWKSYLVYSLLFTIVRFFTVLLVASTIRDVSQKPLKFIYKVASANWNAELTRFSKHIRSGSLALSGRGLFYFTRQLILTVKFAIIVLYYSPYFCSIYYGGG